jgi:hypothetical protein
LIAGNDQVQIEAEERLDVPAHAVPADHAKPDSTTVSEIEPALEEVGTILGGAFPEGQRVDTSIL